MPLIHLHLTSVVPENRRPELLASLSQMVAECIGKPEQYVMVCVDTAAILMSGQGGEAAYAEVRSIGGLNPKVNRQLSAKVCALLQQSLGIAPERVYLNFLEVGASQWGWKGSTF